MNTMSRSAVALLLVVFAAACGGKSSTPELQVSAEPASEPGSAAMPRVVAVDPPNGATGVDPARTSLSATFDREMDREGWAWVIEGPATAPDLGQSAWDAGGRTNTVAAQLEPGRTYVLWINSPQFAYFRDLAGRTSTPYRWTFSTADAPASPASAANLVPIAAHAATPPRVIAFSPPNGATEVDPAVGELRATFDRTMSEGWSWVTEGGGSFPDATGEAYMTPDRRSAVLPVRLAPGRSYVVWLNSDRFRDFRDAAGVELPPVRWTFSTRGAG